MEVKNVTEVEVAEVVVAEVFVAEVEKLSVILVQINHLGHFPNN